MFVSYLKKNNNNEKGMLRQFLMERGQYIEVGYPGSDHGSALF